MNFDIFKEVWIEVVAFFDRLMGWLSYVLGGSEDPYDYDDFFPFPWDRNKN